MRELICNEVHQISGGDFIKDIKEIYHDGLGGYALTAGVISLSTGMLVGAIVPNAAPICAVGTLIAYAIYDTQQVHKIV